MFAIRFIQILSLALGLATFIHGAFVAFYGLNHAILAPSLVSLLVGTIGLIIGILAALFVGRLAVKKKRDYGR